jgi:ADP-heptose:LPS heptosyltransferase
LHNFLETARFVADMDLMITVDTAMGHLSGAMGVPCWMMIPFNPDWRWMRGRDDCAWYDSVKLFRQPAPKTWESVIDDVRRSLVLWKEHVNLDTRQAVAQ